MQLYRLITGPDDSQFCHRVSKALSSGWSLAGSPSITFNSAAGHTVCAQAVTKTVPDEDYREDIQLGSY